MLLFPNGVQGLSDSEWQGVKGSAHRLVGVDYRSKPGIIKVHQKLTKRSADVITELCKVAVPVSDGSTLWFSSESGKIWRELNDSYFLVSTTVLPAWDIQSAGTTTKSKDVSAQSTLPLSSKMRPDGTALYVLDKAGDPIIFQYTLATAFDLSTATFATKQINLLTQSNQINGFWLRDDGLKLYACSDVAGAGVVYQYTLSVAWDISTATYDSVSFTFNVHGGRGWDLAFKPDGTRMFIFDATSYEVLQYTLSTPWNVSTAVGTDNYALGAFSWGAFIKSDGTKLWVSEPVGSSTVKEFVFGTPWEVSTLRYTGNKFPTGTSRNLALTFASDGSGFYIFKQAAPATGYQYSLLPADTLVTTLGAAEYSVEDINGVATSYIYYATEKRLLRIPVADIATDWNTNFSAKALASFKNGDSTYHPMIKQNNRLFIGDKYCIASVNELGVITLETAFNVRHPERITTLYDMDTDLLVGTKEINFARVLRWDTESDSWYAQDSVPESEINAFIRDDNYVYVQAGDFGRLYLYDGEKLLPHTRIPGDYSATKTAKVNQGSVAFFFGVPVFGLSNVSGNPTLQGVYSYGRFSKDYNITMDLSFPLSHGSFDETSIGAIIVQGSDLFVAWKRSGVAGIDKVDWSAKYPSAYIETTVLNSIADRSRFKSVNEFVADYYVLPTGTDITMSYRKNYGSYTPLVAVNNAKLLQKRATLTVPEVGVIQERIDFTVSGNSTPEVENFVVKFEGER